MFPVGLLLSLFLGLGCTRCILPAAWSNCLDWLVLFLQGHLCLGPLALTSRLAALVRPLPLLIWHFALCLCLCEHLRFMRLCLRLLMPRVPARTRLGPLRMLNLPLQ